ncbi:unnamed protein product, partial [Effrenium voratum]
KQEDPSYNEGLPTEFLAWRAQHIYTAYKNIGGAQAMKDLAGNLAMAEPNPIHYAEYMGIYMGSCLAAEGQPPIACLSLLVEEWGVELTIAEWKLQKEASELGRARKKPAARKRPAAKSLFCKGLDGTPCCFNTKEAARPSRGTREMRSCLLCSKALLKQSQASPQGRGSLARVLKALRARASHLHIFEAALDRVALWLGQEAADTLRARAAAPKRIKAKQSRAAARKERLSAARASFACATAKRQTAGPAPPHAAWRAYRAAAVAEQRLGKKKFYPEAPRRCRAAQATIVAQAEVDNAPDLPAASWSKESIALQKWCLRGAWGMCPNCNVLQSRPLTAASFDQEEHAAELRPSACKACKRGARKRYIPQPDDVPADLEGAEGADGQRRSVKRSFRAKLLGPLLGYGTNFALLQFVYDLQLWTELGTKRNMAERRGSRMRLMMAQHPMSPLYWRAVLAGLQDLVRQIGPPQLYWTFAPWELSFPYSDFLLDELRKQLRTRFGAPAHETLHIAHCMLETVRGFVAGGAGAPGDKAKWMAARKRARSAIMAVGGRTVLFWLDRPESVDWEQRALADQSSTDNPNLAAFVRGSQQDHKGESCWPVWKERSRWNETEDRVQLRHSAKAAEAGLRAYFPDLMDCFRCHQDLQASDGHRLLLIYVAKYVAKWSDSSFQEWMSDSAAANSLARKVLFEYHPLEPEMVLQLQLQQYMDSAWRMDSLSFLDFLRKCTDDGDIAPWVKRAYKALPEDHPSSAATLSEFANNAIPRGQIAVAT